MKIIAGFGYDNRLRNNLLEMLGEKVCGEYSLIKELEFRAGLPEIIASKASRVISYLNALKLADNGKRFYSASLTTDPIASAEALLHWRDWAIMHGWQHEENSENLVRMGDLAIVESHLSELPLCLGERIYQLIPMSNIIASTINEVILHCSRNSWLPLYQKLYNGLESAGVTITEMLYSQQPKAPAHTDLGRLQNAIANESTEPLILENDGTIRLFKTTNPQISAQYLAQQTAKETLIIAQEHHYCIGAAITQVSGKSTGLGSLSSLRAPNQLLQLFLQCAWLTPSVEVALQYLTLPVGKFKKLRHRLARHFKDRPGHDLSDWQKIIDKHVSVELNLNPKIDETKMRRMISEWLPFGSCDSDEKMPVEISITLTERISGYWKTMYATSTTNETKEIFLAAFNVSEATAHALRNWPESNIDKVQLNRLCSMALDFGQSSWKQVRDVCAYDIVQSPEAALFGNEKIADLIWVEPMLSDSLSIPPLSMSELSGIPLVPTNKKLSETQQSELKRSCLTLLSASQSLTIISLNDKPNLLKIFLNKIIPGLRWENLEAGILRKHGIETTTIVESEVPFPSANRWWNIGKSIPSLRPTESFSSLISLVLKPHEYVLRYFAKIDEGSITTFAIDNRLKGNLAHKIVEMWLRERPWNGEIISRDTIAGWLDNIIPNVIRQVALPLAQPGKTVERLQFKQIMLNAMDVLFTALLRAQVVTVHPELRLENSYNSGKLEGTMDLFCEFASGDFAVIDMKWGGYNKYYDELKVGRPLQLATYAHIAQNNKNSNLLDAGYFILKKAKLLCNTNSIFPTAIVVQSDVQNLLEHAWDQLEQTIKWRMEQLMKGQIEVTLGSAHCDQINIYPNNILPLLQMEETERKNHRNTYFKEYKTIDVWRNITGNIKE